MGLNIYKRGQGYYTRLFTGLGTFTVVAIGCSVLYGLLAGQQIAVQVLVPAVLCSALGFLIFWLVNKPKIADFMISAEGEIKKVSWSSRKEITASTTIVVITVVSLALLLLAADVFFIWILKNVLNVY